MNSNSGVVFKSNSQSRSFLFSMCLAGLFAFAGQTQAGVINVLTNSGFETGNFSGWTVGGNTPTSGIATDDTLVAGDEFGQGITNVRSGNYSAYYLTRANPLPAVRIFLSQTVSVLANQNVDVGFFVGHGEGTNLGSRIEDARTQIFIDGIGLLADSNPDIPGGTTPLDFLMISGSFNTGSRTSITVSYAIDGSGTLAAINSVDDFFFRTEEASVPEPATFGLLGLGLIWLGFFRRKQILTLLHTT